MSVVNESTRIGIVGTGYIGTVVGEQFHRHPEATVAAITDIDEEGLTAAAEQFGVNGDSCYRDIEAMVENASLDALLIGTPHTLHYEQISAGLDAGLDVLCDKPLTTDLGQAKELVERTEKSERTLMVGYQRHLNPAFAAARERFSDGSPDWISAEITQDWIGNAEGTWRTNPALSGGGMLYDTGSHLLDAICWTSGLEPVSVAATMRFVDEDERIDTDSTVLIEFENDVTANVTISGELSPVREHLHLRDGEGGIYIDGREWTARELTEIDGEGRETQPFISNDGPNKAEAFLSTLEDGSEPPASARDALVVTAITEAAYESARTGERVPVDLDV